MSEKIKINIEMEVTIPQALALQAMFKYWDYLGQAGGSREVAFYIDGDGDFRSKSKVSFSKDIPELTEEMEKMAVIKDKNGDRTYDYDPIAWHLRKLREEKS
jgi:hypothetical protein